MGETVDSLIILAVLIFNAVVGTVQEGRAQNTLMALKKYTVKKTVVVRDGREIILKGEDIVPGDVIILQEGEKIPADARVMVSNNLKVDESAFTGESTPIHKIAEPLHGEHISVAEQKNSIFKGTHIVSGNGRAVVVATGINTQLGKIAKQISAIDTEIPLKANIRYLSRAIILVVAVMNIILLGTGLFLGKGLKGVVDAVEYFAGNTKLVSDLKLSFEANNIQTETLQGKTPIILASKKEVIAVIMVADAIKPEAIEAVRNLHKLGIKTVMLTGDSKNTASAIAKEVGIDEVIAEVLPEDKLNTIKEFQKKGRIVAMAGDGVNDAPALAQADVGIAMGTGTDVAIETAGITLLNGDISKLVKALKLSKMTMRGIRQNLFWAFIYNLVGIPLAAGLFFPIFGWTLNPIFAGLAMAFSSVSVVSNSLRIKTKKL